MFNFRKKEKAQPRNVEELTEIVKELTKKVEEMEKEISSFKREQRLMLQKFSMIRFNPFSDRGGDQSFSLAILNEEKSGVVITSFYSKEGNRVYGKLIHKGESQYPLSKEEEEAITNAYNE